MQNEAVATLKIGLGPASRAELRARGLRFQWQRNREAFPGRRRSDLARHLLHLAPWSPQEFSLLPFLEQLCSATRDMMAF